MKQAGYSCAAFVFTLLFSSMGFTYAQPVSINNANAVSETFNSLATSGTASSGLPPGWSFVEAGSGANTTYTAGTGSNTTGDTYSFGASSNADRALGELTSGAVLSTFGATFTNNTGGTISSLTITYTGERWRLGALNRTDRLDFQYSTTAASLSSATGWVDVNTLDYVAPTLTSGSTGALDGNNAANRTSVTATISGLSIANGATFWIRWTSSDISGSDDGLGVDDFSISAAFVPITTTYYPRTNAIDLSQPSQWTTDINGSTGTSPTNFTSSNQIFNLNANVSAPTVSNPWALSGGSNLILNNTAPLVFTATAGLTIGTGSTADFNDKAVTLKSTASGTAFIGNTTGSITNATNVTVERYISSAGNRAYRLLAPSVSTVTSIRSNWQEGGNAPAGYGTHITGSTTGANGFDATQTGNPSLYLYNASPPAWQAIANTNATPLSALNGYLTFIRGDRTVDLNSTASPLPTNNTVLRATGSLLTGTAGFNYLSTTSFQLITNPYPSSIDWAAVRAASTGIEAYYTFWDPNIGSRGGYVTVNANGTKSPATSNGSVIIPSGMAFFVKGSGAAGGANIEIRESHKTTSQPTGDVFRTGTQTETFSASLFYTNGQGQRITADGVLAVYNNDYSTGYDEADAMQIANWDEDVSIMRSGNNLSIQSRPLIDASDTIHLSMARMKVQNYEWQFDAASFNHPGLQAVLVDNFLTTRTALSLTGQTLVQFAVTTNAASAASNRFAIVFENPSVLPVRLTAISAQQKGKDVQVQWTATSDAEAQTYEVEKSGDGRTFTKAAAMPSQRASGIAAYQWLDAQPALGKHFYRIKAVGTNGSAHYSAVVAVDLTGKATPLTLYPNPVKGSELGLSLQLPAGSYTLRIINTAGQTLLQQQLVHAGGAAAQTITLPRSIGSGVYQLVVSSAQTSHTQRFIKH